jgi:hypothetical protein
VWLIPNSMHKYKSIPSKFSGFERRVMKQEEASHLQLESLFAGYLASHHANKLNHFEGFGLLVLIDNYIVFHSIYIIRANIRK